MVGRFKTVEGDRKLFNKDDHEFDALSRLFCEKENSEPKI